MCNFISWVEKDGQLLYLTDDDIFSSYGKEVLAGCKDNDFLGHGAIRRYYGKDGKDLEGGKDYEVADFWNTNELPTELAEKVNDFDKYWGKTFSKYFTNYDLINIIEYAPDNWKNKAWEQLLRQNPTNYNLCDIICNCSSEAYKEKAWLQLLKQNPTNEELYYIMCYCISKTYKEKAWEQLLKQNPTNSILCDISYDVHSDKIREEAYMELMKRNYTGSNLREIVCYSTSNGIREKAWTRLHNSEVAIADLEYIIKHANDRYYIDMALKELS